MSRHYLIQNIIDNHNIIDYLQTKGYEPVFSGGDRWMYHCPSPSHNDSDPSFSVFTINGCQYFKCFGCGIKGDIINLYSILENVDIKQSIKALGDGCQYCPDQERDYIIDILQEEIDTLLSPLELDKINLEISVYCYISLKMMNLDAHEVRVIHRFYKKLDKHLSRLNYEKINQLRCDMSKMLHKRCKRYKERI